MPNKSPAKGSNGNAEVPRDDFHSGQLLYCFDLTNREAFLVRVESLDHDNNWVRYQMTALQVPYLDGEKVKHRDPKPDELKYFKHVAVPRTGYSPESKEGCDWRLRETMDIGLLKKVSGFS